MAVFEITKTEPKTYVDRSGNVIQGYRVHYSNIEFDEADFVDVPRKNSEEINKAILAEVVERKKMSQLGK